MKKRLIILLICLAVSAAMCLCVSLIAPGEGSQQGQHGTKPTLNILPGSTSSGDTPVVRLYVCGNEDPAPYETLAQQYTQQTGVECTILTGDLNALLSGDTPPTIFCMHSQEEAQQWKSQLCDLSGTDVLSQLYSDRFALYIDGTPVGLAMDVTGYGVIYNASLLARAGYTRSDITDFSSFRQVVEAITAARYSLGFSAFAAPDFSSTEYVSMLMGVGGQDSDIRAFLDLTLDNNTTGDPLTLFTGGKTVFYVGGAWEYEDLAQVGFHNLDLLPFFTADGAAIPCVCSCYWGVNVGVGEENAQYSLDFLAWLVTAGENGTPVDILDGFAPFRDATGGNSLFMRLLLRKYLATEPVTVRWSLTEGLSASQLRLLTAAFEDYAAEAGDEAWQQIQFLLP